MSESYGLCSRDGLPFLEEPVTPDEDGTFGAEPDDPRALGRFQDPYVIADFDPAHEQRDMCGEDGADG
jgi:hypothetical protein